MHSNNTNTQINIDNLQMCTCTPPMLQCRNLQAYKHQSMPQTCINAPLTWSTPKAPPNTKPLKIHSLTNKQSNSNSRSCMSGPITYWSIIELEIRLHKQIHIQKGIWAMLGVRWSPSPLASPIIAFSLFGSYNAYGISQLPLWFRLKYDQQWDKYRLWCRSKSGGWVNGRLALSICPPCCT